MKFIFKLNLNVLAEILQQVMVLFVAFFVTGIVILVSGYDLKEIFSAFLNGIFKDMYTFATVIRWAVPLIIGGIAVAIAFRAKLWNIGIEGQFYLGAVVTAYLGFTFSSISPVVHILFSLAAAAIVGGLWAGISGVLRAYLNADELITTFMLSFVAILITTYLVLGPLRYPGAQGTTVRTQFIEDAINLPRFVPQYSINYGIILAIVAALIVYYVINYTSFGYEVRMLGTSPGFARLGGINVNQKRIIVLFLSGAIAAFAGGIEVLAVRRAFVTQFMPGIGFDSIVVALFANSNPIGVIFSGLFFSALRTGAAAMERTTEVPRAMVAVFQSIIIFAMISRNIIKENSSFKQLKNKLFKKEIILEEGDVFKN